MDHGVFPNVTYSNTTCKNAMEICEKIGISEIYMYHVTRAYHTRHGNGDFDQKKIELQNNEDEHNVSNEFQRDFKTGKLDYDLLNHALICNKQYYENIKKEIMVVTCCDHITREEDFFDESKVLPHDEFVYNYSGNTQAFGEKPVTENQLV
jgi:adenylosuccinate synthase